MKLCKFALGPLLLVTIGLLPQRQEAATVYWDVNGATAGSGAVDGSTVIWDGVNPFWNSLLDGTGSVAAWNNVAIPSDTAAFAAGTDATGTYTITVSGTQNISGLTFQEGTFTLSGGTLDIANAAGGTADINVATGLTSTVGSVISGDPVGTTVLTKTGLGTLVLSSAGNTFGSAGKTLAIQQGTLSFDANAQLGTGTILALGTATDVATLRYTGATATISRAVTLGSLAASTTGNTITVQNAASVVTWSGIISGGPGNAAGNTALTINGPGTLILSGANTFTGDIIIDGAKAQFNALSGFGLTNASGSGNKTTFIRNGGTIIINASLNPTAAGTDDKRISIGTGGGTIQVNPTFTYTLDDANQFSGTADVTKTGTGILVLGNTYAGYTGNNFFLNAGTLRLQAQAGALGTTVKPLITMAGSTTLDLRHNSGGAFNNAVKLTGDAIITTGRTTAASTNINHTMGTLEIGSNTLTVNNGNFNNTGFTANLTFGAVTLTGNPIFNVNNNNGTGIGSLTLGALNDGGTGRTITKTGPGTLILAATATSFDNAGVMNILDGALSLNATNALGTGAVINVGDTSGATSAALRMGTANTTTSNAIVVRAGSSGTASIEGTNTSGTVTYAGDITLNKDVTLNSISGGNVNFTGVIDDGVGTFNVVVGGNGTVILGNTNTYNGSTSITGGRLQVTSDGNLGAAPGAPTAANLVINGGALAAAETFVLHANRGIVLGPNAGSGSGTIEVLATKTLTYNGVIANNGAGVGALIKTGNGTLKLGGANTYAGATTVNAGTLQLDFNAAGAPASDIISGASALVVGGGRLLMSGKDAAASVQNFNGLTVNQGASTIQATEGVGGGSSATLNLGSSYVNNGGAVNFVLPASGSITLAASTLDPTTGLLRGASVNGTSFATINGSNQIVAFNSFVNKNDLTTWVAGDHITNTAAFFNSLTADVDISSLRFNFTGASNAALGAGRTLTVLGGIQVTSNVGANASTISTGSIRGSAGGMLYVLQNNTAGDLTISSTVVDNTSATAFVKAGQGRVILGGANTYTGLTTVAEGALRVTNASGLGTGAAGTTVSGGAALELVAVAVAGEAITLAGDGIASGGALRNISGTSNINTAITLAGASRINSDSGTLTIDVASGNAINGVNTDLTIGGAGSVVLADAISLGAATLTKDGAGSLVTGSDAALGGSTVVVNLNGGKLTSTGTRNYANSQVNINANMTFGDSAAAQTGAQTFTSAAVNLGGATRTLTTDEEIIFGGVVSNGAIIKNGDDFIQFNNANNTFNGYTASQGDTRIAASGNVLGTGLVTFNATNVRLRSNDATARSINNNVSIQATTILGAASTGSLTIGVLGSTTMDFNAGSRTLTIEANTTLNSAVVNGTGLTKGGAATLTFLGTNTQTGNIQINTGNITVMGPQGRLSAGNGFTIVGDNNGNDESLTIGDNTDSVSGTVNRVADDAGIRLNGSVPVIFNGPTDAVINEIFANLDFAAGVGVMTLNPIGTGEIQLNITNLQRSNGNATGVIRATGLGQAAGTAGSSRVIFTNAPTTVGLGGTGSSTSIVPFLIGGTSTTAAPDTFLAYDAVTGVKPLTNTEYESAITGGHSRNVSVGGAENVSADVIVNALRMTPGGSAALASGTDVVVRSGALLFTGGGAISGAGSITLGESLVNGTGVGRQAVIHVSGDTTSLEATISANLHTAGGLVFGDAGNVGHTLVLSGDNNIMGGITVNGGTLRVGSAGAFNNEYYNDLTLRAGNSAVGGALSTVVQTYGNNVAVVFAGNDRLQGSTRIQNGLAATTSTLTILATATSDGNDGILEDGAGVMNLVKRGTARVQFEGNNTYTGTTEIFSGEIRVSGTGGRLSTTPTITIRGGGSLYTHNQSDQTANRINDTANIFMHGGSYQFDQNQSAFNLAEVVGNLSVLNGDNVLITDYSLSAQTWSITFNSLSVASGSTLNFTTFGTAGSEIAIGETNDNQVFFTTDPTLTSGGLIGGNVYHTKNFNNAATQDVVNFASYDIDTDAGGADTEGGVIAFAGYNTGADSTWTTATVANPTASVTLTASRTIEAIRLGGGINVDIGAGQTLNLTTGGLIHNGASATISNGTLTAGGNTAGDLFIRVEDNLTVSVLTISSVIADNGGGAVSLTKSGTDELTLSGTNTYTGRTTISGGAVNITSDSNLGAAPASATAGHLRLYGGTLAQTATTGTVNLNGNRGLELGGAANTISTAGTSNLVYNASSITSNGDSSLTLVGDVDMAVSGSTNISGNFIIQGSGAAVSLSGASNFIGGTLQVGAASGASSFIYNVAGGTLTVGGNNPNQSNLDVGVRTVGTTGAASVGTMNLSGTANFIATVDRVRIGTLVTDPNPDVGTQGTLTLSTNATITAGTEVIISDSAADGLASQPSSLNFGAGTSNLTTKLLTVGGRKGNGSLTIAGGGVLNLGGFGERTLDIFVGRNNVASTAVTSTGNFNFASGTLNASIDELIIADKSGGGNSGAKGTFTLGTAAHSVTINSMVVGRQTGGAANVAAIADGLYEQGGGAVTVLGDITLSSHDGGNGSTRGILNLNGGTFTVGGNISKVGTTRSSAIINVNGGTLDLQDQANGDTTKGTFSGSQLTFRAGSIVDAESVTLDGVSVTSGTVVGTIEDALILRDVTVDFDVLLSLVQDGFGGILYESAGGGSGAVINGDLNLGGSNRDINVQDSAGAVADMTIAGQILNSGTVTKQGDGTLVLANAGNTHGTTMVSEGVLQVGQGGVGTTGTGLTFVAFNATLAGTGTVTALNPAVTTHIIEGTISPGDLGGSAMGNLKFEGNLTFNSAADAVFQLGNPTNTYDRITGTSSNDTIILDGTINAAELDDSFFGGYGASGGETWFLLMDWATINLASFNVGTNFRSGADGIAEGDLDLPTLSSGLLWDVSNFAVNGSVTVFAVPEPGRALLLFLGLTSVILRRRSGKRGC